MSRPLVPLSQVVLKVHSRCDLACDHCYVYEDADQSWRGRPMVISDEVAAQAARRIAEHAAAHWLPVVQVILHGGEPLLAGRARLRRIISELRRGARRRLPISTCGSTPTGCCSASDLCELFAEHQVKVGISLDGDRAANDRHRRYCRRAQQLRPGDRGHRAAGQRPVPDLYAGLLCTIDVANDPVAVYEALMDLRPPRIDFLLPHATWDHPPARAAGRGREYADWLIAIFDRWVADGRPARIRTFESIIVHLAGRRQPAPRRWGSDPTDLVVIETDGSYEQVDSLKVAYDGAPATGLDVFGHSLDTVAEHPASRPGSRASPGCARPAGSARWSASCGGGLYAHRYRTGSGFDNPSVYCADLLALISHVSRHQPARARPGRNACAARSDRRLPGAGRGPG